MVSAVGVSAPIGFLFWGCFVGILAWRAQSGQKRPGLVHPSHNRFDGCRLPAKPSPIVFVCLFEFLFVRSRPAAAARNACSVCCEPRASKHRRTGRGWKKGKEAIFFVVSLFFQGPEGPLAFFAKRKKKKKKGRREGEKGKKKKGD
jgi:hypothetical protein